MTNAELAILTLIAEKPRHGYEIEQVIEARGMRNWTEVGFSSIYYLLKKLQKKGLIEGRTERQAGRGPARVVYHITPAGRAAVHQGVREALSMPQPAYPPLQIGMANLPGVSKETALSALGSYRDALQKSVDELHQKWESQRPLPYFVDAMFDYSIHMIQAELAWIRAFILQVEEKHDQGRLQEGI